MKLPIIIRDLQITVPLQITQGFVKTQIITITDYSSLREAGPEVAGAAWGCGPRSIVCKILNGHTIWSTRAKKIQSLSKVPLNSFSIPPGFSNE